MQHSESTPSMARHARTIWQISASLGTGRLGPLALHMVEDRHLACQVAIRSGGLTTDQINAVDFGRLGTFLRGLLRRMDGDPRGHTAAQGVTARHDTEGHHDKP